MTTVPEVNRQLRQLYGADEDGQRVRLRAGRGYYYFTGTLGMDVDSLYTYRIADMALPQVLEHVASSLRGGR